MSFPDRETEPSCRRERLDPTEPLDDDEPEAEVPVASACGCPTPCPMVCPYIVAHGSQHARQGEYVGQDYCDACIDLDRPALLVPACERDADALDLVSDAELARSVP